MPGQIDPGKLARYRCPMARSKVAISRGAVAAEKWRKRNGVSVTAFARAAGLDRRHLSRILAGDVTDVGACTAAAIARATGGEVSIEAFAVASAHGKAA